MSWNPGTGALRISKGRTAILSETPPPLALAAASQRSEAQEKEP